ncbi:hypothetical protein NE237_009860 [Protea cynaroides]|uniref:Uncharacterized protein n=1 Tax=Protea cynaroides TaxID=273540 RepID=A0A9Q0R149_9MAGN|nr:hypothetical protein NE237_009860 [Protea cynaroides]
MLVRGDRFHNSASNSIKMKKRMPRQGNEVCRSSENNHGVENLYAAETQNQNQDEIHRGNNVEVPGKYPTVPKKMRSQPEDYSKDLYSGKENLGAQPRWSFLGEFSSADKDLGRDSFCNISAEAGPTSLDLEFFSEDHSNALSSLKRFKFDVPSKCAYPANEKAAVQQSLCPKNCYDSTIFSNTESSSKKPDASPAARMEGKAPDSSDDVDFQECTDVPCVSRFESVSKFHDEKSEFQHTYCGKFIEEIRKEVSVGNFESTSSENGKVSYDADSNDNCGEYNVANDDILDLVLKSKTSSPDCAEKSTIKDKPGKLEKTIDAKKSQFDAQIHRSSPSWKKDNDASRPKKRNTEGIGWNGNVNSTYQIMLQSYVQLLCVQKVQKEANEQVSLKKA